MLSRCVAVVAGKGGVLKTSAVTHLAGAAASHGRRTLLVDADPQGNAMYDLGYASDGGESFAAALVDGTMIVPTPSRRPNLDIVAGGPFLDDASARVGDDWWAMQRALSSVERDYDVICIDSPAREPWLRRMIMTTASVLVVAGGIDRASRVGLADVARTVNEVRRKSNPDLEVIGVFAGPLSATAIDVRARTIAELRRLISDDELVCDTVVRYAPMVAEACRERGILVTEWAASPESSPSAQRLAHDWSALCHELLDRFDASVDDTAASTRAAGGPAR